MATIITMPKLGLTMTKGTITLWLKREGDEVRAGDVVCEIETDKITAPVESPADGIVLKIIACEFEERDIMEPLCVLGASGEVWDGVMPSATVTEPTMSAVKEAEDPALTTIRQVKRQLVSPIARRLAEDNGVDLAVVIGTGPDGRIEKKDVEAWLAQAGKPAAAEEHKPEQMTSEPSVIKRVPLSGLRKVVAERLSASKREIPHVYFKVSVDATEALETKRRAAESAVGKKPTLNDAIVKAVAQALHEIPEVNSTAAGGESVCYGDVNIGIAVDSEKGLYVPVLRLADRKNLLEIAEALGQLVTRAREGRLSPDDLAGGTFTISNLGAYGVDDFFAVINPPQAAILAVGQARDMPVVVGGGIQIRPMMNLTLSVDHRVIDGALAARFLAKVKRILEAPL